MVRKISSTSRVIIFSISALAIAYADHSAGAREGATYDYVAPQVAPASALPQLGSMAQIAAILNETAPPASNSDLPFALYQLTTVDEATQTVAGAAPLKVVQTDDTTHPYLAV